MFVDRHDAGRQLAERLLILKLERPVVLALPRGGVPVGFEITRRLRAPLDLMLVRKIGAPFQKELAVGAIADGGYPELVVNDEIVASLDIPDGYFEEAKAAAVRELERRREAYLAGHSPVEIAGRTAIVVDDGIATGATMIAALRSTRHRRPAAIVLAVPVAASDVLHRLRPEVDRIVCLRMPSDFMAVGAYYDDFRQLRDSDVITLLDRARAFAAADQTSEDPP
jgi:putative phosphoribosyl transferase